MIHRKLFCPYLLSGFPSMSRFTEILHLTSEYADLIEVGIPFSDPVADGPVIRTAAEDTLSADFRLDSVFRILTTRTPRIPIAVMSYANPILGYGRSEFLEACRTGNVRYLVVPDVPYEESGDWKEAAREKEIQWVSFVSLQTRRQRLKQIVSTAEGFIYLLAVTGITGSQISAINEIRSQAKNIRTHTGLPVLLGFGITSINDTKLLGDVVDGFIIGSKIVEIVRSGDLKTLESFYKEFHRRDTTL